MDIFSWEELKSAITGNATAFRKRVRLSPAGGQGSKVFPPTYVMGDNGGYYAWERRRIDNEVVQTVLLDSVQSQANRIEQALLNAYRMGELKMPLLQVDFRSYIPELNEAGVITTLDAPHRIADAIFRDSLIGGKKFRESDIGKEFTEATIRNATGMLKWCPHALVFGIWDSTGSMGGLGNKFQRVITSEIVGFKAEKGVHTSSRMDPLGITTVADVYEDENEGWTLDIKSAKKNKKGEAVKIDAPSKLVHGNIPPTIEIDSRTKEPLRGGVTIDYALQTSVISLPALRRLHFPIDGRESADYDYAGQSLLAALALYGLVRMESNGYDLRSGCLLIPVNNAPVEIVMNDGSAKNLELDSKRAQILLETAIAEARKAGLPWDDKIVTLQPEQRLVDLVRVSRSTRKASKKKEV